MMRRTAALALLSFVVVSGSGFAADNAELLACLQQKVKLADGKILSRQPYAGSIEVTVTNDLSWALSGIYVKQVVRSESRSVPWFEGTVSDFIAGGIEPGETRTIRVYFEGLSGDVPEDVLLELSLLDVGDPDGNQMLHETHVIGDGWTDKKSELGCN